jgi:hypothetical protein
VPFLAMTAAAVGTSVVPVVANTLPTFPTSAPCIQRPPIAAVCLLRGELAATPPQPPPPALLTALATVLLLRLPQAAGGASGQGSASGLLTPGGSGGNATPLARPTLGKKQPQCQHDWYFASRKRQR